MAATARAPQATSPVAQYRQAAVWLIAAFAAVGAALAAGIQVSSLGSVHGWRLAWALGGAVVGFAGIVLAIWHVGRVLEVYEATTSDLRATGALTTSLNQERTFLGGFGHPTVGALIDDYENALRDARTAEEASWARPGDKDISAHRKALEERFFELSQIVEFLRGRLRYETARTAYLEAKKWLFVGAVLAFVGLIGFAYFANPPKPVTPTPKAIKGDRGDTGAQGPPGPPGRVFTIPCPRETADSC